jgi:hypothetical protein
MQNAVTPPSSQPTHSNTRQVILPQGTRIALEKKASMAETIASSTNSNMPNTGDLEMIASEAVIISSLFVLSTSELVMNPATMIMMARNKI